MIAGDPSRKSQWCPIYSGQDLGARTSITRQNSRCSVQPPESAHLPIAEAGADRDQGAQAQVFRFEEWRQHSWFPRVVFASETDQFTEGFTNRKETEH